MDDILLFSYRASSKVDAAKLMSAFVERIRPGVKTIIHRDRDFMSEDEIERLRGKYQLANTPNMKLFITKGSDIENYFTSPDHLAATLEIESAAAQTIVEGAIQEYSNEFITKFLQKREEVKRDLYKNNPDECPTAAGLLPPAGIPVEQAMGKLLLKRCAPRVQLLGKNPSLILSESPALVDENFQECLA